MEFCSEDIYIKNNLEKNINNSNENYVEDEPIFLVELTGGAIVLAKNQKIKLFK